MNEPILNKNLFGDTEVDYPARVAMKAITFRKESGSEVSTEDYNKEAIITVLDTLRLKSFNWKKKNSNAGKYVSYSFSVTIEDADQLKKMYSMLNELDVVKMLL